jgi:hypothetical protein
MYRVSNPEAESLALELKDTFDIPVKPAESEILQPTKRRTRGKRA